MPRKRLLHRPGNRRAGTLNERVTHLEALLSELTRTQVNVRREEHDEVLAAIEKIEQHTRDLERHTHDLDIQFKRIAQIQADLDEIKRAWARVTRSS